MKEKEPKYKIGETVSFRNNESLKSENSKIVSVETSHLFTFGKLIENAEPFYLLEHENGFVPNKHRVDKYKLDPKKKYIFVTESKLS